MNINETDPLRVELSVLRAGQAAALRETLILQDAGATDHEAGAAMQHVMRLQSQVNALLRRIKDLDGQNRS